MTYEEICDSNKMLYECLELLLRTETLYKALRKDSIPIHYEVGLIKSAIAANLKEMEL